MGITHYTGLPEYQKLEDIWLSSYIDSGIANLVRALWTIRVDTHASCEGHLEPRKHRHPWIGINPFQGAKIVALKYLVGKYNETNEIKWQVAEPPNSLLPSYEEFSCTRECGHYSDSKIRMTKRRVKRLQQSADELAQYIFDNRGDKNIRELLLIRGL